MYILAQQKLRLSLHQSQLIHSPNLHTSAEIVDLLLPLSAERVWKAQADVQFIDTEISVAKEALGKTCKAYLGDTVNRQCFIVK